MLAGPPNMPFEDMVRYYGSIKIADFGLVGVVMGVLIVL